MSLLVARDPILNDLVCAAASPLFCAASHRLGIVHFASNRCGNLQSHRISPAEIAGKGSVAPRHACCCIGHYDGPDFWRHHRRVLRNRARLCMGRQYNLRGRESADTDTHFISFTAQTRMSGVDVDAQPAHLRLGWHHRSVRRNQSNSSGGRHAAPGVGGRFDETLDPNRNNLRIDDINRS